MHVQNFILRLNFLSFDVQLQNTVCTDYCIECFLYLGLLLSSCVQMLGGVCRHGFLPGSLIKRAEFCFLNANYFWGDKFLFPPLLQCGFFYYVLLASPLPFSFLQTDPPVPSQTTLSGEQVKVAVNDPPKSWASTGSSGQCHTIFIATNRSDWETKKCRLTVPVI